MERRLDRSNAAYAESCKVIPGGVNSPVRAFRAVGGTPIFAAKGKGPRFKDLDGNEYIDYVCSWGPLIHGHAHPVIVEAIIEAAKNGSSFGMPTEAETTLARMIVEAIPSVEKVRLVNSGTEATMSAIRLARGVTGRDNVIKFEGGYHGHVDALLVKAGSGLMTFAQPSSPGVPASHAADTIVLPYNNIDKVSEVCRECGEQIACVIVEPVAGNMGVVPPREGFLEGLREVTERYGILLIFDEVITGFRVGYGGAQALYGVTPDLTTLGKIIGGGLPVGAYGGRADLMDKMAPEGDVYQAGTLSGNPLAVAAGIAALRLLQQPGAYERIERRAAKLCGGIREAAERAGVTIWQNRVGSMFCTFFTEGPVADYTSAARSDVDRYRRFFWGMASRGIYFAPSQFEAGFVSTAHGEAEIDETIEAAREVFAEIGGRA